MVIEPPHNGHASPISSRPPVLSKRHFANWHTHITYLQQEPERSISSPQRNWLLYAFGHFITPELRECEEVKEGEERLLQILLKLNKVGTKDAPLYSDCGQISGTAPQLWVH